MDFVETALIIYFAIIFFVSFIVVGIDKLCAKWKRGRVPEKTLFLLSIMGGSAAVYFGMSLFNHKTQKNTFVFLIPLIFAAQCVIVYLLYRYDFLF